MFYFLAFSEPLSNENEEVLVERFEFPSSSSTETTTTAATFPVTQDAIDGNVDDDDEDSEDIAEEEDYEDQDSNGEIHLKKK